MIGITFGSEQRPGIPLSRFRGTHCAFMAKAMRGRTVQIHVKRLSCPVARYYLGVEATTDKAVRSLLARGDARQEELAGAYLESGWRLEGAGPYITYFPYPDETLEPDVLVMVGTPARFAPIVHELNKSTGKRLVASISGLGAACGECTAYPLATGMVNVSLGCRGCRPVMKLDDGELLLAVPRASAMFDVVVRYPEGDGPSRAGR